MIMNKQNAVKALAVAALFAWGVTHMKKKKPLGIRNNNPLNLREAGINWNGKTGENKGFTTFETPFFGIRAAANDLKNGWLKGERSVREIVSAWAPTSENDTESYIKSVLQKTGLPEHSPLLSVDEFIALIKAMIYHENGEQPFKGALIQEAVLAGMTSGAPLPFYFELVSGDAYA